MSSAESLRYQFDVEGMDCPSCAGRIERRLRSLRGVSEARVNFAAGRVAVTCDPRLVELPGVVRELERLGHPARPVPEVPHRHDGAAPVENSEKCAVGCSHGHSEQSHGHSHGHGHASAAGGSRPRLLLLAAAGMAAGFVLEQLRMAMPYWAAFYALAIVIGGAPIARAAWESLRSRHVTDMNCLMTIAVIGAVALGEWAEAATIVFLFAIAEALEGRSVDRTRLALRELLHLAPEEARLVGDHAERVVPVAAVRVGDRLLIRPGDHVPLDGEVLSGSSSVNQAAITGESVPVEKTTGDELFAGTLNESGSLEMRVTRPAGDSTLARVVRLVEEAQSRRAATEQFVDRFAGWYTPAVITAAVLLAVLPPLFAGATFATSFYRALTLLLIACPCALVISTPVAFVCALARAARSGALVKGGAVLERLAAVRVVAFDKTGTLTHGRPRVTAVLPLNGVPREEVLRLAAGVERHSEHAVAHAIVSQARHEGMSLPSPEGFQSIPGKGATARVEGRELLIGKPELFAGTIGAATGDPIPRMQAEGNTVVCLGTPEAVLGVVAVADTARDAARAAIGELRELGIERIEMLTGDNAATAGAVARELGIAEFRAELMPAEKLARVEALAATGDAVAMVGDGVNDAPALAAATVGVAMGAAGTDVALETADVALMGDDLRALPALIRLGRRTMRTIYFNIAVALAMKAAFVALTLSGHGSLWLAVVADTGCSLLVVANSLRLLRRLP